MSADKGVPPGNPQGVHYRLGITVMDDTHKEFMDLLNRLGEADKKAFSALFNELVEHTERHFSTEDRLMKETGFPATQEHMGEHRRVLGELERLGKKVAAGSTQFARAYVTDRMPGWFGLHFITMDSALAAHLQKTGKA